MKNKISLLVVIGSLISSGSIMAQEYDNYYVEYMIEDELNYNHDLMEEFENVDIIEKVEQDHHMIENTFEDLDEPFAFEIDNVVVFHKPFDDSLLEYFVDLFVAFSSFHIDYMVKHSFVEIVMDDMILFDIVVVHLFLYFVMDNYLIFDNFYFVKFVALIDH